MSTIFLIHKYMSCYGTFIKFKVSKAVGGCFWMKKRGEIKTCLNHTIYTLFIQGVLGQLFWPRVYQVLVFGFSCNWSRQLLTSHIWFHNKFGLIWVTFDNKVGYKLDSRYSWSLIKTLLKCYFIKVFDSTVTHDAIRVCWFYVSLIEIHKYWISNLSLQGNARSSVGQRSFHNVIFSLKADQIGEIFII